jgi:hypothetical protein
MPIGTSEAQMRFEMDDGKRPDRGVVVSLLDQGNSQSRLIMDEVRSHGLAVSLWIALDSSDTLG